MAFLMIPQNYRTPDGHRAGQVHARLTCTQNHDISWNILIKTRKVIEQAEKPLGPIDVLVNNGEMIYVTPIYGTDMAAWDESLDVNLRAPALLWAAVLPGMRE